MRSVRASTSVSAWLDKRIAAPVFARGWRITYITPGDPPVLTFHGDLDPLVPVQQARALDRALKARGVSSTLVIVPAAGHGWGGVAREKSMRQTLAFLDRELKGQLRSALAPDPFAGIRRDIVYATPDGAPLHLDLAMPRGDGPFPAIVCFHGGNYRPKGRLDLYNELLDFSQAGFVAASVEYRGMGRGIFPAPLQDARAAVGFLRVNAGRYHVDPARIGAFGVSFGGWEALMLALTNEATGELRVKAVVDRYGPTDFSEFARNPRLQPLFLNTLGTADPNSPKIRAMSPLAQVSADDPPVLIVHNPADQTIPIAQSEALTAALKTAGVPVEFIRIAGSFHASELRPAADVDRRAHERVKAAELAFFRRWLSGR